MTTPELHDAIAEERAEYAIIEAQLLHIETSGAENWYRSPEYGEVCKRHVASYLRLQKLREELART